MSTDSVCTGHEQCPRCGSRDNLARYDDGHAHCFTPGCEYREPGRGEAVPADSRKPNASKLLLDVEYTAILPRGLAEDTCRKFHYALGKAKHPKTGKTARCHVATYCDDSGQPVAQKLRFADKAMKVIGDSKAISKMLYGRWLWRDGGKKIVVTEGEIDALSMSQLQGNKWPVVSIPNGAQGAVKSIAANLEWLCKFDEVILMFDADEPGRLAVEECVTLFPPRKVKVARIEGFKDANEALVAKQGAKALDAMWGAKEYRPEGILEATDDKVMERAFKPIQFSAMTWPWESLQRHTYGRRFTELYGLAGGTGIGKTTVFKQWQAHAIETDPDPVGIFSLEEPVHHAARTLAGVMDGVRYHVPGVAYDESKLRTTLESLRGKAYFFDPTSDRATYEAVIEKMRYMRHAFGVRHFFLDNLTSLIAMMGEDNERKAIDRMMADFVALMIELDSILYYVSHLNTPEGKAHEEGGRVKENQLRGSRAIAFASNFIFAVEGDKQQVGSPRTFRILKDRNTGDGNGVTFGLQYDRVTGRLVECDLKEHGFRDETVIGEF